MRAEEASVLVVIPAWNEELSVAKVVADVRERGYTVLVVDDGSHDATTAEAARAGATTVTLPVHLGVGAALRCGFRYAVDHGYSAVVQVDADGQHPAASVDLLVAESRERSVEMLIGSRFASGRPDLNIGRLRRFVMAFLARIATRATGTRLTDTTSGFRVIREPLLSQFARSFPTHYLGDTYEAVVAAGRAGYAVDEIGVEMRDRAHGTSSASPFAAMRLTVRAFLVATTRLHFSIEASPSQRLGTRR